MTGGVPQTFAQVGVADTFGATPERCIDLLQIRPLLFGTAWKVLDMLVEAALATAGETPDLNHGRWSIGGKDGKASKARASVGRPAALNPRPWQALMLTYVTTVEVRHSLVHRSVFADSSGSLVGHDRRGNRVRPVTSAEQEALGRAALRASQLVLAAAPDERAEADLTRQLGQLVGVHGVGLPSVKLYDALPEITVVVGIDPAAPARYASTYRRCGPVRRGRTRATPISSCSFRIGEGRSYAAASNTPLNGLS
jgi:hypothetical protein